MYILGKYLFKKRNKFNKIENKKMKIKNLKKGKKFNKTDKLKINENKKEIIPFSTIPRLGNVYLDISFDKNPDL